MSLKRTTDATSEPITTAEAKTHLRVDTSDDDTYIGTLIASARNWCEVYTARQIIAATYVLKLDEWPEGVILLPRPPLASITHIRYVDTGGTEQTWASSKYDVDTNSEPGRVVPAYGETFPSIRGQIDSVIVTYVAGWANAAAVPVEVRHAVKMMVAQWYEHREPTISGLSVASVPLAAERLLYHWRMREFV